MRFYTVVSSRNLSTAMCQQHTMVASKLQGLQLNTTYCQKGNTHGLSAQYFKSSYYFSEVCASAVEILAIETFCRFVCPRLVLLMSCAFSKHMLSGV